MEQKHFFTPRFLSVEEVRNAAGQQPQVSNQSKVAHDSHVRHNQEKTEGEPLQQTIQPLTQHGSIVSFRTKTYSMTFDKLRIGYTYYTNKAKPFEVVDWEQFTRRYTKSGGCYYEHKHPPIDLYICFGLKDNGEEWEVIIEFTSTVLQERMMDLISNDNIRDILRMLDTDYHLIRILDIENFISKAYVYACDVTKDQYMTSKDALMYQKFTYDNRINTRASKVDLREGTNFILENKVRTASKKKVRLTFYDKYKKLVQDSRIAKKLPWGFNIEAQQGKYRLELELKNRELVKEYLNLRNNTLREVLNSREQPIRRFYWELIKCPVSIQPFVSKNWKDYQNYVTAKASKFDLAKIEERLRMHYHPWRTSLLTPYISICNGRRKMQKAMRNLTSKVKEIVTLKYEERRKVADLVG
jgi:hypothetical protein